MPNTMRTMERAILMVALCFTCGAVAAPINRPGLFEAHAVGSIVPVAKAAYDSASDEYRIGAAGAP